MKNLRHIMIGIGIVASLFLCPKSRPVRAIEQVAGVSGVLISTPLEDSGIKKSDIRMLKIKYFLESVHSPLASEAETFVREADEHQLDWRLLVAIAGVESTFGKYIPTGSYNGWGWGIPTGAQSGIAFQSWSDAIATISDGLKKNYIDRGATTVESIGHIYAASPFWAGHVRYYLEKIDQFKYIAPKTIALSL